MLRRFLLTVDVSSFRTSVSFGDYVQALRGAQPDQWGNQVKEKDLGIRLRAKSLCRI